MLFFRRILFDCIFIFISFSFSFSFDLICKSLSCVYDLIVAIRVFFLDNNFDSWSFLFWYDFICNDRILIIFLQYNTDTLPFMILLIFPKPFLLYLEELYSIPFFFLKLLLFLFLTDVCLKIFKLFLCCSFALIIVRHWLRKGLDRSVSDWYEHLFLFFSLLLFLSNLFLFGLNLSL